MAVTQPPSPWLYDPTWRPGRYQTRTPVKSKGASAGGFGAAPSGGFGSSAVGVPGGAGGAGTSPGGAWAPSQPWQGVVAGSETAFNEDLSGGTAGNDLQGLADLYASLFSPSGSWLWKLL